MIKYTDANVPSDNPKYSTKRLKSIRASLEKRLKKVEDLGFDPNQNIISISDKDGLVVAIHTAYDKHNPFTWSPDIFWLRIAQCLATHIRLNSDTFRDSLVNFEGVKDLRYRNDTFVMGAHNQWELFFESMASQIGENTKNDIYDLFTKPFSTTSQYHQATANGLLMNSCANYFTYTCETMCGIPEFHFKGTVEDWEDVLFRCKQLKQYGLDDWYDVLKPIVEEFIRAVSGEFNLDFWRDMYKLNNQSGGPFITGWVTKLYLYLTFGKNSFRSRLTMDNFPDGLSSIPFVWKYYGVEYKMDLVVGPMGIHQDPENGALTPAYGWVCCHSQQTTQNTKYKVLYSVK